jgi:hypothetical protein
MSGGYWVTRFLFQRSLALIYLVAFLIAWNQFRPLCGDHGLLPARLFLKRAGFWDAPSLFQLGASDRLFAVAAGTGLVLSVLALTGITDAFGAWLSALSWLSLWVLYSSFVNVGQTFYGFGWEMLLGEVGFIAVFMGPTRAPPAPLTIWLLRWVLFRLMFGAGLIKLRGDPCWRDFTCMSYHYETQPLPGPLSWYFHQLPGWVHRLEVMLTHFLEVVVPLFYFGPRRARHVAGALTVAFQLTLMASGNLSWLNCLTLLVSLACFDDSALAWLAPVLPAGVLGAASGTAGATAGGVGAVAGMPAPIIYAFTALVAVLSVQPVMNLLSRRQLMNSSFDPFHLVNTYGAFGSITRTRNEVILEGTSDAVITPATKWLEYEFKGKPGAPGRRPRQVTPYHFKLDWQLWFAAMSEYHDHPWILNLVAKLLANDADTLGLIAGNPFPERPPMFIRAELYEYRYAKPGSPDWWDRRRVSSYLPPLSLKDSRFAEILKKQGWSD